MDFTIVTNNTIVNDNYENIIFVEGDFFDVLLEVRNYIHLGQELISYLSLIHISEPTRQW